MGQILSLSTPLFVGLCGSELEYETISVLCTEISFCMFVLQDGLSGLDTSEDDVKLKLGSFLELASCVTKSTKTLNGGKDTHFVRL